MYDIRELLNHYKGVNCRCVMEPMDENNKGDNVMNNTKINWIIRNVTMSDCYSRITASLPEIEATVTGNIEQIDKSVTMKDIASYMHKLLNNGFVSPEIKKVHFNPPATVVLWADGSKTVVKTQDGEDFDPEKGLAMAIAKKSMGNQGNYYNEIKKWVEPYEEKNKMTEAEIEDALKRFHIAMSLLGKGVDI